MANELEWSYKNYLKEICKMLKRCKQKNDKQSSNMSISIIFFQTFYCQ